MKVTFKNIDDTHFRVISIKNGKVFCMTCKKGRVKGPAKSFTPSATLTAEEIYDREVENAAKEGFTLSVDNSELKEKQVMYYMAEIAGIDWHDHALSTFLRAGMVIPNEVGQTLSPITDSDTLSVKKSFNGTYSVHGQVMMKQDNAGNNLLSPDEYIRANLKHLIPLLIISRDLVISTNVDDVMTETINDDSETTIDPMMYLRTHQALIDDYLNDMLVDQNIIVRKIALNFNNDLQTDCMICI